MNHDLEDIDLKTDDAYYGDVVKVRLSKFNLTFVSKDGDELSFQRVRRDDADSFDLKITKMGSKEKTVECSLGHTHVIEEDDPRIYSYMAINWEHAASIISWLEEGIWKREPKKKSRRLN